MGNQVKRYWAIKIRVLRKVFSKQFCFIRCRRQHLWAVEKRWFSRFTLFENTISTSPKATRAKFLGSNRLFCLIKICMFSSFKNPFSMITSLSEHYFSSRFILLVQMKKVISLSYDSNWSSWKPWRWVRLDLIFSMIYTLILTWTHSQNSLAVQEATSPPTEHLSNDHEDHPNQHKNSHNLCDEMRHPVVNLI